MVCIFYNLEKNDLFFWICKNPIFQKIYILDVYFFLLTDEQQERRRQRRIKRDRIGRISAPKVMKPKYNKTEKELIEEARKKTKEEKEKLAYLARKNTAMLRVNMYYQRHNIKIKQKNIC